MSFAVGDKVIHFIHGFGEIITIESKEVSGVSSEYYVLRTQSLLLWIPIIQNKDSFRLPTTKNKFIQIFDILRSHNLPFPTNRSDRKYQIHNLLTDGAIESICRLIRDLSFYRMNHKLNDTDTLIYKSAVSKLLDEWEYSMSISQSEALVNLNSLLHESYILSSSTT